MLASEIILPHVQLKKPLSSWFPFPLHLLKKNRFASEKFCTENCSSIEVAVGITRTFGVELCGMWLSISVWLNFKISQNYVQSIPGTCLKNPLTKLSAAWLKCLFCPSVHKMSGWHAELNFIKHWIGTTLILGYKEKKLQKHLGVCEKLASLLLMNVCLYSMLF